MKAQKLEEDEEGKSGEFLNSSLLTSLICDALIVVSRRRGQVRGRDGHARSEVRDETEDHCEKPANPRRHCKGRTIAVEKGLDCQGFVSIDIIACSICTT